MANAELIRKRIQLAKGLIKKLKKQVKFTPSNRPFPVLTDNLGITKHGQAVARVYDAWEQAEEDYFDGKLKTEEQIDATVLANSLSEGHGNCDMKSLAVYNLIKYCPRFNSYPLNTQIFRASVGSAGHYGHSFNIICSESLEIMLETGCNIKDFGEEAVICDGWQSDYYAPNVKWPYGRIPGPEKLIWRKLITHRSITVDECHSFHLPEAAKKSSAVALVLGNKCQSEATPPGASLPPDGGEVMLEVPQVPGQGQLPNEMHCSGMQLGGCS